MQSIPDPLSADGAMSAPSPVPAVTGALALAVGLMVLVGWAENIETMKRIAPGLVAMNPTTATCIVLMGLSLILSRLKDVTLWMMSIVGGVAALVGGLKVIDLSRGTDSGIDRMIFAAKLVGPNTLNINAMAPNTAICLFLLGASCLCLAHRNGRLIIMGQLCALGALLIAVIAIFGYAIGILGLYVAGAFFPMALHTAVTAVILALGLLWTHPESGAMATVTAHRGSAATRMPFNARVLTATFTVLMIVLGAAFWGEREAKISADLILRARTVQLETTRVLSLLQDAETGQRGYILTGDTRYLRPYEISVGLLAGSIAALTTIMSGDAIKSEGLAALKLPIDAKLDELSETIRLERDGYHDAAIALVRSDTGQILMDDIRRVVGTIIDAENRNIADRQGIEDKITAAVRISEILGLIVIMVTATLVLRQTKGTVEAQQRAYESQVAATAAATAASKSKSDFLASMSHELRTPLNSILGFTGTLLMRLPGPLLPAQEKQLNTVQKSARHLLALINQILDLAKVESGKSDLKIAPVECESVLKDVTSALRPLADAKNLDLHLTIPAPLPTINTDRRAVTQIIINLANNAIKFTAEGRVDIRAETFIDNGQRSIKISVTDTGPGIAAEDQVKLFSAFTHIEAPGRGKYESSGLGLHVSQKLAEALGGRIIFDSVHGVGSTFALILPEA